MRCFDFNIERDQRPFSSLEVILPPSVVALKMVMGGGVQVVGEIRDNHTQSVSQSVSQSEKR